MSRKHLFLAEHVGQEVYDISSKLTGKIRYKSNCFYDSIAVVFTNSRMCYYNADGSSGRYGEQVQILFFAKDKDTILLNDGLL